MKKKNIGILFIKLFLKSFCIIMLLLLVGIGSYQLTMMYFKATDAEAEGGERFLDIVSDVTAGEASLNLIYKVSEDQKEVKALVLEILNTRNNNLDYITIPQTTRFTISNDMYQRINVVSPEAPQIVQMSRLKEYFKDNAAYEYGIILLEDYFNIDIGYYTVIPEKTFDEFFELRTDSGAYAPSEGILQEAGGMADEKALEGYIKEKYNLVTSNLKVKQKIKYVPTLLQVKKDMVYVHVLEGKVEGGAFEADAKAANQLYNRILSNSTYTVAQNEAKNIQGASLGLNIVILNGSKINGLAATYKEKLEQDGYTVSAIGDYSDGILETTKIYVRKKNMGKDLLGYFGQAEMETKKLDKGVDIQIILGKADAIP